MLNDIIWDYGDDVRITLLPVNDTVRTIKNGTFITKTHPTSARGARNIHVIRSNVVLDNIIRMLDEEKHLSAEENPQASSYTGFISTNNVARVTIQNTKLQPLQGTGTYALSFSRTVNLKLDNVSYPCVCGGGTHGDCEECYIRFIARSGAVTAATHNPLAGA